MCLYESSKDYPTGVVTIRFDERRPTTEEIENYCSTHYGFVPKSIYIEDPDVGYGGFANPGFVKCHPREGFFG